MKKILSQQNIYTFIVLLYLPLSYLVSDIRYITIPLHGLYLAMSVYYIINVLTKCRVSPYIKALTVLFAVIILYALIFLIVGTDNTWLQEASPYGFLRGYFGCISPIYAYYYFGTKKMIDEQWFRYAGLLFVVVVFLQYFHQQQLTLMTRNLLADETTNNAGYMWLAILPISVFYRKKPVLMYSLITFFTLMIFMCYKRGAILCGIVVVLFILLNSFKESKNKIRIVIISVLAFVFLTRFVQEFFVNNTYAAYRLEETLEGNTSGRDRLYLSYSQYFVNQSNLFSFIFGNGALATFHYLGMAAHNDWLEFAINMGVFGIVIYLYYWIVSIRTYRDARRYLSDELVVIVLGAILLTNFLKTIFSMSINDMQVYSCAMLGYCLAEIQENQTF